MTGRYVASVAERITWSTGFHLPVDQLVLGKLSTFGNFMTGTGCRPSVQKLAARVGMKQRNVHYALRRLEADGWIQATRRHRYPTSYDINLDRLATHPIGAKVTMDLACGKPQTDNFLTATECTQDQDLTATGCTQDRDLTATGCTQNVDLTATGCTPSQEDLISRSTEISIPDLISSQPTDAARRPMHAEGESQKGERETEREPQQGSLPPMDVTPGAARPAWSDFLRDVEVARAEAAAHKRPVKQEAG